ncbi:MAG TPA: hydantoinase/oxoprolinase family protein [Syntrophales bacterium]|nr:hydantoinase/oxoprolinase family protein [Syntrophales bacterium]HOL59947.1 hydantoinase/oxoprolinase family protein [Syntrophales bacterium]HPO36234.1 hydantoinase/oxoprolinase family protein [Syntrophales bacterium]
MILGIDVGGTHTDAVLLKDYEVERKAKVRTNPEDLLSSLLEATSIIFDGPDPKELKRVVLSTTLSTNAIVQNKIRPVGMIIASGPGLPPSLLPFHEDTYHLSAYMNHRGFEVVPINEDEVKAAVEVFRKKGIEHLGVVGKFCTRNPSHELEVARIVHGQFKHVSLGHTLSGRLNFRRRIATTYLNAAVSSLYRRFALSVMNFVRDMGVLAPVYVLKADGGTIGIEESIQFPCQTILSGPAASIMGVLCLARGDSDAVALDIGGTTTDIAVFADGVPLLEGFGVRIGGWKTLIRGLRTKSIGVGGDSRVRWQDQGFLIGPEREGDAAALGGPYPTPTDAMVWLGLAEIGDRKKAGEALGNVAKEAGLTVDEAARQIFSATLKKITAAVKEFIDEINNEPVYTIHELLEGRKVRPVNLYLVGGPAQVMAAPLGEMLGLKPYILPHAEVANAIGAALARTTTELTLIADTEKRALNIAEEGETEYIPPRYRVADVIKLGKEKIRQRALKMGAQEGELEIEVVEEQEFNMVRGFDTVGKNIRVKLQIKPGLIAGCKSIIGVR